MRLGRRLFLLTGFAFLSLGTSTLANPVGSAASAVSKILSLPDDQLDYASAAIAFDRLADPSIDSARTQATIAQLLDAAQQMAGPNPTDIYKRAAIRKAIYESGPWNDNRAFAYDQTDPLGRNIKNKLLATYVRTRRGNCVSMPILFLILADKMGLNVRLATAPLHVFVRYTDTQGITRNLEATSGGQFAREEWYRQKAPMSDRAIESGIYMRTLSKRDSIAEMANTLVDLLIDQRRYQEAIEVADAILKVNPREAYTMVRKGHAFGEMMRVEFLEKYPTPALIPSALRPRFAQLAEQNERAFKGAEALGWQPD
jgi:regulator of sirC expression with transglutaminase-like and TPR domain